MLLCMFVHLSVYIYQTNSTVALIYCRLKKKKKVFKELYEMLPIKHWPGSILLIAKLQFLF